MKTIRRIDRAINTEETIEILNAGEYGVLSTVDSDGQPLGIPLSYVHVNKSIYFHCALEGQKLDNIAKNSLVSFCVVGKTKVLPEKFSTEYESAIVFGTACEVQGVERRNALLWILEKYCSNHMTKGSQYIDAKEHATKVIKIDIRHMSGKARR